MYDNIVVTSIPDLPSESRRVISTQEILVQEKMAMMVMVMVMDGKDVIYFFHSSRWTVVAMI